MALLLVLTTASVALLLLAVAISMIALSDPATNARLQRHGRTSLPATVKPRRVAVALHRIGAVAGKGALEGAPRASLRMKLMRAGFYAEHAVEAFYAIRVICAAGLGLLSIVGVLLVHPPTPLLGLLPVLAAVAVGLYLPNLALRQRIASRRQALRHGLPDAVDLMVVCLEAGGTLSSAMQRVQAEFGKLHPVLAEQLGLVLAEMQAGASRSEALGRMSERVGLDDVDGLVTMLVQSEALGASVAQTMRVFADQMRSSRYLDAERRAAELPVKLAFPLVLFIFPALMTVIFTPLVIRIYRVLLHT